MKLREFLQQLASISNASKFVAFFDGVSVQMPGDAGGIVIRAHAPIRSLRPTGLNWNEFSYVTEVEASNGIRATGYGEANSSILALQKSIAEGVERVVFRSLKQTELGTRSSNGWAAHLTALRAEQSAMMELFERDTTLLHWLTATPFFELGENDFPKEVRVWTKRTLSRSDRFKRLRVLVSKLGYVPTVTTILLDESGYAVLSHSTDRSFETAIERALSEACRIAHIAMTATPVLPLKFDQAVDHALAYAFNEKLPPFIFGEKIGVAQTNALWTEKLKALDPASLGVQFHTIPCGPLFVSRASSDRVQDLFFGETEKAEQSGWINARRITEAVGFIKLNPLPHFVP